MSKSAKRRQDREDLKRYVDQWVDEILDWNQARPEATLAEIEEHARLKRRELMSQVLAKMLEQHGAGYAVEGIKCPKCGQAMTYKGSPGVTWETREASTRVKRAYYRCPSCKTKVFPPGSPSEGGAGGVE